MRYAAAGMDRVKGYDSGGAVSTQNFNQWLMSAGPGRGYSSWKEYIDNSEDAGESQRRTAEAQKAFGPASAEAFAPQAPLYASSIYDRGNVTAPPGFTESWLTQSTDDSTDDQGNVRGSGDRSSGAAWTKNGQTFIHTPYNLGSGISFAVPEGGFLTEKTEAEKYGNAQSNSGFSGFMANYGPYLAMIAAGGLSALHAAGVSAAAGGGNLLGLTQMGEAAGLQGQALADFVASGGTAGSTAAGGGGVGVGAGLETVGGTPTPPGGSTFQTPPGVTQSGTPILGGSPPTTLPGLDLIGGTPLTDATLGSVASGGSIAPYLGGTTGALTIPGQVVNLANSAGPTVPGTGSTPGAPGIDIPQTPPTPPGGETPNTPQTPQTPTTPSTPSTPNTPGTPGTPTPPPGLNQLTELLKTLGITPQTAASIATSLLSSALTGGSSNTTGGTGAADQAAAMALDRWNYYKQHYEPLESQMIEHARTAGSPEEFARAEGEANAAVTGAFDKAKKQTESRLQSFGINPGAPAYQAAMSSTDLAEGAAGAGQRTLAANNVRNLAYSKGLDVLGLGKGIPAQSAASANSAANTQNAANAQRFNQNNQEMRNIGALVSPVVSGIANSWFGNNTSMPDTSGINTTFSWDGDGFAKGGIVGEKPDGNKQMKLKMLLMKKGLSDEEADRQSRMAVSRRFSRGGLITPHRKMFKPPSMYADGGGVGRQGNTLPDASNMGELQGPGTETSDSIPAVIDGKEPAALSTGEVVINAAAVNMTGQELLEAINQAGLKRRNAGLDTMGSEPGTIAYNRGGSVRPGARV